MSGPIKGGGRCPKCACRKVRRVEQPVTDLYARTLEICVNCGVAWEPLDPVQIWDKSDPHCSFRDPCDNCAFRPGSPEQRDPKRWSELMSGLKGGAQFFCHKGVPLDLDHKTPSDSGFAYPYTADGKPNLKKLRLCRGYLNMLGKILAKPDPLPQRQRPNGDAA